MASLSLLRRATPALLLAFSLAACASQPVALSVQELPGFASFPPEPFITVLPSPPASPYVSLARITATGAPGLDRSQALAALEAKARALGANAVIVTDETARATPALSFNPAGGITTLAPPASAPRLVGLAIRIPHAAPSEAPAR